jgi:hypothetical protein
MIPLLINAKHLCQIFEPELNIEGWTEDQIREYSLSKQMYPTEVKLTSETYSRDAERTADYELEFLNIVNRKSKPEFTWTLLKADYVQKLLDFLEYHYDFKDDEGVITPEDAPKFSITYLDFIGMRTIQSYVGQTVEGTLVEYDDVQYWQDFRIAFPEF